MLTAVVTLFANFHIYKVRRGIKQRVADSYIGACCIWQLGLFAATEILSAFHAVRFITLSAFWAAADCLLIALLALQIRKAGYGIGGLRRHVRGILQKGRQQPWYFILWAIGAAVFYLALRTTPYNWDSMTYHLPRIAYWIQNRSVEHYATHDIRQISSPVLAEFVNLHVCVLCRGSDRLFNLLQAASYFTCAYMAGAIAGKLGCSRSFRFMASLLYMAMPIAYAEALTTQVDNFAAVWLLFYVYLLLDLAGSREKLVCDRETLGRVCVMGLCVSWGYLTKPSVCIAMVVFAVWLLVCCVVRKDRIRQLLGLLTAALPCVALPLIPELVRNFRTFHAYASSATGARQLVGTLQPAYLFVNFLKNVTFNMPTALLAGSDEIFAKIAAGAAGILHVELNAETIAENGIEFSLHEANTYGCDVAVNPLVLWLFILCVVWGICTLKKTDWKSSVTGYSLTSAAAFCIFCTILRWEPFVSRYMVSYLALLCPMISAQLQRHMQREERVALRHAVLGTVGFLCVMSAVSITHYHYDICMNQGAAGRPYGYFHMRWGEGSYYAQVTDEIKSAGYASVGLHLALADDYEYPIWKMLSEQHIEHVGVENESAVYADESYTPDCVIWFGGLPEEPVTVNGRVYAQVQDFGEWHYLLTE